MDSTIEVILFDLGGVLVELGESPIPLSWLPNDRQFGLSDWFTSETAQSFEKGLTDAQTFATTFKSDLKINASPEEIIQHFTAWPVGVFPSAHDVLSSIKKDVRLAVLSNTNELHWPRITDEFEIETYFEHMFASHHLKMAKPELTIYEHVIHEMQVKPGNILFLDDNQSNIEAAKQLGIQGVYVKGIEQVHRTLFELGLMI